MLPINLNSLVFLIFVFVILVLSKCAQGRCVHSVFLTFRAGLLVEPLHFRTRICRKNELSPKYYNLLPVLTYLLIKITQ